MHIAIVLLLHFTYVGGSTTDATSNYTVSLTNSSITGLSTRTTTPYSSSTGDIRIPSKRNTQFLFDGCWAEVDESIIVVVCFTEFTVAVAICFYCSAKRHRNRSHVLEKGSNPETQQTSNGIRAKSIAFYRKSRASMLLNIPGFRDVGTQYSNQASLNDVNDQSNISKETRDQTSARDTKPRRFSSFLRSSSFKLGNLLGRKTSQPQYASGVYDTPWDQLSLSSNLSQSKSNVNENNDGVHVDGEIKQSSQLEVINETTHM